MDVEQKCGQIRSHSKKGDWTTSLSDLELYELIVRYRAESAEIKTECEQLGIPYFDIGLGSDHVENLALEHLLGIK